MQSGFGANPLAVFDLRSARAPPCPPLPPSIITCLSAGAITGGAGSSAGKQCDGHPGRVLSLSFVGTSHAPAVLSTTSEGYSGVWNIDSLADPAISCIPLSPSQSLQFPPLSAVSSIAAAGGTTPSGIGNMSAEGLAGRIDGALLIHSRGGGLNSQRLAKSSCEGGPGHSAPITCISTPASGGGIFRDLAVTCSMDWSMKLWSLKVVFLALYVSNDYFA